MGWLDVQGCGGARALFAETATALGRRQKLDGAAAVVTGKKTEKKEERRRRRRSFIGRPRKQGEATVKSFPRQREAEGVHARA